MKRLFRSWLVPAAMSCLLTAAYSQADPKSSAFDHSKIGLELARSGHLADAERELRQATNLQPHKAVFQAQLGSILGLEGHLELAAASFSTAVSLQPDNPDYRRELAAVQWQLRQFSEAEKNLRFLLQSHPQDHSAVMLLGMVRESEGGFEEAAQLLSSEFSLVLSRPERILALLHSDYGSGKPEQARQVASTLLANASNLSWRESVYSGAHLAIQAHDLEEAGQLLQALAANNSGTNRYQIELANLDYYRGNFAACVDRLNQLKRTAPEGKWVNGLLGKCYVEQRDYDAALDPLKRAIQEDPADLMNYASLLVAYENTNNLGSATDLAARAVQTYPKNPDAWTLLGAAQIASGHFLDAVTSYEHALALNSSSAEATIGLGNAQLLGGRLADARTTYEKAIVSFPDDPRLFIGFATALAHSSDESRKDMNPKIEWLLRKAIALDNSLPAAHYLLGQTLLEEEHLPEAVGELQIAERQDPGSARTHYALQRAYRRLGRSDDAAREFELFRQLKGDQDNDPMGNRPDLAPQ